MSNASKLPLSGPRLQTTTPEIHCVKQTVRYEKSVFAAAALRHRRRTGPSTVATGRPVRQKA